MAPTRPGVEPRPLPRFHHVGVQTSDLDNSLAWYRDFLGLEPSWTLTRFSELTRRRLPGIRRLTELVVGGVRVHLLERDSRAAPPPGAAVVAFQHVCVSLDAPEHLQTLRRRWVELYASGRYAFALPDQPSEIVVDDDGVHSFYALDVNGLEFEFTHVPSGGR